MIGWLKGEIIERQAPFLLLNVAGVGYEIQAPMTSFYALENQTQVELYTHLVVREDAQLLYGFATKTERRLFRHLIKVNGVGPKSALSILSGMNAERFVACVQNDDVTALVKIPGIGKKTAERLVIEMRDKLNDWHSEPSFESNALAAHSSNDHHISQEAESALIALGYKPQEAAKMIQAVFSDELTSAESLIRAALKRTIK